MTSSKQFNYNARGAQNNGVAAFLCILIAEICLVLMGHFVKLLSLELDTLTVFVVVQVVSVFLLAPLVIRRGIKRLRTAKPWLHVARCLVGVAAMFLMFYAYDHLDLSLATLLKLLSPAFIPFVAVLILGEKFRFLTLVALGIALAGVWVSSDVDGHQSVHLLGFFAVIFAAVLAAFGKTLVRLIGHTEDSDVIAFYFACFGAALSLPTWLLNGGSASAVVDLEPRTLSILLLVAALACVGQYMATLAYTKHRAAIVGLFTYLALPIAGLVGILAWGESMSSSFLIGSALILVAGIIGSISRLQAQK